MSTIIFTGSGELLSPLSRVSAGALDWLTAERQFLTQKGRKWTAGERNACRI